MLTLLLSEERRKAALRDEIRRAVMSAGSRKPERRGQGEGTRGLEKGGVAEWMLKGTVDTEADQDPSGRGVFPFEPITPHTLPHFHSL